jgi:hypothetical protein
VAVRRVCFGRELPPLVGSTNFAVFDTLLYDYSRCIHEKKSSFKKSQEEYFY